MDNDLLTLIRLLLKKSLLTTSDLQNETHSTRRQVAYRVEKLNHMLQDHVCKPITFGVHGEVYLETQTKHALKKIMSSVKGDMSYIMNKKERMMYMYFMLFLHMDYVSQMDFMDQLGVSRSTILLDFKDLQQELKENGIEIKNNRTHGYHLAGEELQIRSYMMQLIICFLAEEKNTKVFDLFIDAYHLDTFDYFQLVIIELAKQYQIRFVEDRLSEFIYIFIFLRVRMQRMQNDPEEIAHLYDVGIMDSLKEYHFTKELLKERPTKKPLTETDIYYISAWILGISVGDVEEDTADCAVIAEIVEKIMVRFESLSGIHYKDSEDIFRKLYSHFRPAYYRLLFKLPIVNPLSERVKSEYADLYQLISETVRPFTGLFHKAIPEAEIAYLTIHFTVIYSKTRASEVVPRKKALIVCLNGIGSSAILYSELTELFPEMYFYAPMESSRELDKDLKIDIIFTTNDMLDIDTGDIPVIKVSPVMNFSERYQISREVYYQLGNSTYQQPNTKAILNIVRKHANIHNEAQLENELITYFSAMDIKEEKKTPSATLLHMVDEHTICLHVDAKNWEEAIRICAQPMIDHAYIKSAYVEEIVRIMKVEGPFVVITKHVALPHAKPSAGALRRGIGIGVLEEPIVFGNKELDPIKYIFTLSATDNESHLTAMSQLLDMFNNKAFFKMLDKADSSKEVLHFLQSEIV
ncbi:MAG: PTS sugar transporter subunit IIA [Longicatena sp.]